MILGLQSQPLTHLPGRRNMETLSLAEIIRLCVELADNDPQRDVAWAELVEHRCDFVRCVCARYGGSSHDADEFQSVFWVGTLERRRLERVLARFRQANWQRPYPAYQDGNIEAYLRICVQNACRDLWRRCQQDRNRIQVADEVDTNDIGRSAPLTEFNGPNRTQIVEAIQNLSRTLRIPLWLSWSHVLGPLPCEDVADLESQNPDARATLKQLDQLFAAGNPPNEQVVALICRLLNLNPDCLYQRRRRALKQIRETLGGKT